MKKEQRGKALKYNTRLKSSKKENNNKLRKTQSSHLFSHRLHLLVLLLLVQARRRRGHSRQSCDEEDSYEPSPEQSEHGREGATRRGVGWSGEPVVLFSAREGVRFGARSGACLPAAATEQPGRESHPGFSPLARFGTCA